MWVFNLDGFFSVVEDRNNPGMVLVRARYQEDLGKAAKKMRMRSIFHTPSSDYLYRVSVPKEIWVAYIARSAAEINYDNFKAAVMWRTDGTRLEKYHEVWAVMAGETEFRGRTNFQEDIYEQEEEAEMRHLRERDPEEQDRRRGVQHRR